MNGDYLYEAMGKISPAYIEEAEKQSFSKPLWRKLLPLAACLAVILSVSLGGLHLAVSNMPAASTTQPVRDMQEAPPFSAAAAAPVRKNFLVDTINFFYDATPLLPRVLLIFWDELLAIGAAAVPLIALMREKRSPWVHALSFGLYLAYLSVCVCSVLVSAYTGSWAELQQSIWHMLRTGGLLLIVTLILNGLLYLPKRRLAVLLALAASFLLILPSLPDHTLIDADSVAAVEAEENQQTLVTLINLAGGNRTAHAPSYYFEERTVATITMKDGTVYDLRYIYDNGFSFALSNFGEDSYHYVLTEFDSAGNAVAAWQMDDGFETIYRE